MSRDPFIAGPGSSVAYADNMSLAAPSRIGSPGVASQVQSTSAPQLSASRPSSSGWSRAKTPWYLRTAFILVLIALLLIALALGLGLGLGLIRGDSSVSAASDRVASTSIATVQSTFQVEQTASNSVVIVPSVISNTAAASTAVQVVTLGGSTVVVGGTAPVTRPSVVITVSETVDPSTSTALVTRTIVAGVQTITSVVNGGGTVTVTRTQYATVTGFANRAKGRRMVDGDLE